jgi:hypothetical protein
MIKPRVMHLERPTDLFVENSVVLVDIRDVALIFVRPLAGEFAFLVNAAQITLAPVRREAAM